MQSGYKWLVADSSDPRQNLQLDDDLLSRGEPVLRIWESSTECVVLGRSGNPERDVHLDECSKTGVPVLRRSSGGGAVVLGPGCLNYSLIIPFARQPECRDVRLSFEWIVRRMIRALAVPGLVCQPPSDISLHERKISGNAQRRTQDAILHHGTLLYAFDAARAEFLLKSPVREPRYRTARSHLEFLGNLPLGRDEISRRVQQEWC
jgi:lipoate-protein ligase A